jgi:deazaflavin-dependent oxidoreductase (nitroreductase family)
VASFRFADPYRPPGRFRRAYAAVAASRGARFISRHVNWKLDPFLLRVSRGRFASTLVFPTAVLETRGARTGKLRRNAVIYFADSDHITIAASHAGSPRNPGWYYNLIADPHVAFGGVPMRATVVDEAEHDRLWALGDWTFPAFERYRRDAAAAGRTIPLIQLTPESRDRASFDARRRGVPAAVLPGSRPNRPPSAGRARRR